MSQFIDDLRKEHRRIKDLFIEIGDQDLFNEESRDKLVEIRGILADHLQKEDEEMYPRLKDASSDDEHFRHILNFLEDEIKLISRFVFIFFDNYSNKPPSIAIEREFNLISSTLIKRIEKEEEFFFPRYERIPRCVSSLEGKEQTFSMSISQYTVNRTEYA